MNTVRNLFDDSDNSKELELAFQRKFARQHFVDVATFSKSNNFSDNTHTSEDSSKEVVVELNPLYALELLNAIDKIHHSIRSKVSFELLHQEAVKVMSIEQMNKLSKLEFHLFADKVVWAVARKYKN